MSSNRVVTAAHCVSSIEEEFARIRVKTYTGKTTSAVAKATTHPRYALLRDDGPRRTHVVADIAVVSLTKPILLPQYPVFPSAKTRGEMYLYGMSEHRTFEELPVRQVTTKAKNWFNHVDSGRHIAAVSHNGMASCAGDSGGGLVAWAQGRPVLLGIVSYGALQCGDLVPTVFTRVSVYSGWVRTARS